MSTATWDNVSNNEYSSNNKPVKIVIPIAIFVVIVLGVVLYFISQQAVVENFTGNYIVDGYYDTSPSEIRIIEVLSGHAWTQHGESASKALDCLGRRGSTKSLKTTGFQSFKLNKSIPTNVWLCLDIDGSWFAVVTTEFLKDVSGNNVARLVTAYAIDKNLFPEIGDYLMYIGEKWGASYISKIIGAGQIYIQPK